MFVPSSHQWVFWHLESRVADIWYSVQFNYSKCHTQYCWYIVEQSSLFPGQGGHAYLKEWLWWAGLLSSEWHSCFEFVFKMKTSRLICSHTIYIYHVCGSASWKQLFELCLFWQWGPAKPPISLHTPSLPPPSSLLSGLSAC